MAAALGLLSVAPLGASLLPARAAAPRLAPQSIGPTIRSNAKKISNDRRKQDREFDDLTDEPQIAAIAREQVEDHRDRNRRERQEQEQPDQDHWVESDRVSPAATGIRAGSRRGLDRRRVTRA